MRPFAYHRPIDLASAAAHLTGAGDARLLAGGQSLLPLMKSRQASPDAVVDLAAVPGLSGIVREDGVLSIGAMTRHGEIETDRIVADAIPALAHLVAVLGDPAVRNRGTLGGALAHNDPAGDYPAACLALGATIVTNLREIPAEGFFRGAFATALERGEIVTRVLLPVPARSGYAKFRHPASRFALAGVFVAERDGAIRVGVTGAAADGAFRWGEAEAALQARFAPDALAGLKPPLDLMGSDIYAEQDYRAHLVSVMARRAVEQALDSGAAERRPE